MSLGTCQVCGQFHTVMPTDERHTRDEVAHLRLYGHDKSADELLARRRALWATQEEKIVGQIASFIERKADFAAIFGMGHVSRLLREIAGRIRTGEWKNGQE